MANGDAAEPYTLTKAGDPIPGIGEAGDPTSVTIGGDDGTTHTLANHEQIEGDWDNVYMPQPKTREGVYPYTLLGENGPEPTNPTDTDGDIYRYWPAHRDIFGDVTEDENYITEIGIGGCDRYESGPDLEAGATTSYSSDEGFWGGDSYFGSEGTYLGSPGYASMYRADPGDNNLGVDTFPNLGDGTYSTDYIAAFRAIFARGYFTDCCTNMVVSSSDEEGPEEWGSFSQYGNLSFGIGYWDTDEYGDYESCGYVDDDECCTVANACGEIFIRERISTDAYVGEAPYFIPGGFLHGHTTDSNAGRAWLHPDATYNWRESDIYAEGEPTVVDHEPPGKFGIPDNKRTDRQWNMIVCSGFDHDVSAQEPIKLHGSAMFPDGSEDETEICVRPGSFIDNTEWFVNEGSLYDANP